MILLCWHLSFFMPSPQIAFAHPHYICTTFDMKLLKLTPRRPPWTTLQRLAKFRCFLGASHTYHRIIRPEFVLWDARCRVLVRLHIRLHLRVGLMSASIVLHQATHELFHGSTKLFVTMENKYKDSGCSTASSTFLPS